MLSYRMLQIKLIIKYCVSCWITYILSCSSSPRPYRQWGTPSLLGNVYRDVFLLRTGLNFTLTACLILVSNIKIYWSCSSTGWSYWPRSLRHGSSAALLLGLPVRISAEPWMVFFCECCVLSGIGLCVQRPPECGVSGECKREAP